jgi:hypothetical protein
MLQTIAYTATRRIVYIEKKREPMKAIIPFAFFSLFVAAPPVWAHSICQYMHDETQCRQYSECVWLRDASGSGQCVYQKGTPEPIRLQQGLQKFRAQKTEN